MNEETKPPTTSDVVTEQDKGRCAPAPGSGHLVKRVSRMNGKEIEAAIEASHPMETEEAGVMDADALAMHLVGVRHEKRELVNLVRWLLIGAPNADLSDRAGRGHQVGTETNAVKTTRWKSITFGVLLGAFCLVLVVSSVRLQIVQSKQADPIYQAQLKVKNEVQNLTVQLLEFALVMSTNGVSADVFSGRFQTWIERSRSDLDIQGQHSDRLYDMCSNTGFLVRESNSNGVARIKELCKEFNRLAGKLPNDDHNL